MKRAAPTGGASRGTKKARAVSDDEDAAGDDDGEWLRAAGVPLLQYVLEVAVDACVCVCVCVSVAFSERFAGDDGSDHGPGGGW